MASPIVVTVRVRCAWLLVVPFALWWLGIIGPARREQWCGWLISRLMVVSHE